MVIMVAPGMIPAFPIPVTGVNYDFRCEAVTTCQVVILELNTFVEISLGIASADFKRLLANYVGRWDLVHLRCSNLMCFTLAERLALVLLELSEHFGTPDRRGVRLIVPARHKHLAEPVGASRPRVTEHLLAFRRDRLIVRTAGHMVVMRQQLESFLTPSQSEDTADAHCQKSRKLTPRPAPISRLCSTEVSSDARLFSAFRRGSGVGRFTFIVCRLSFL